jgi:hypothetical protein
LLWRWSDCNSQPVQLAESRIPSSLDVHYQPFQPGVSAHFTAGTTSSRLAGMWFALAFEIENSAGYWKR